MRQRCTCTQRRDVPGKELVFIGRWERAFFKQRESVEGAHFDKRPDEKRRCL